MQTPFETTTYNPSAALGASRNKVLRNTYMLLGLSMVPTVIGALVGMSMNFTFLALHPIMYALVMFGVMMGLGIVLLAIFALWLLAAWGIYMATLGPQPPASVESFIRDVFTTHAGWTMIGAGIGVGFMFAVLVLAISVVSFPLLLHHDVGLFEAVATSLRAVGTNPGPMALWGLVVAGGLVLGSIPLLVGLAVVVPVLGHATWHLYRRVIA